MKAPAFQFYVKDWRTDANLRRCTPAARGVWMDVLCLLHDSDEYGVLRWPLRDIAQSAGASMAHIKELVAKEVLRGADTNAEPFVWAPTHAGKVGDPVTLVEPGTGPCWYSRRFVKDEYVRQRRGATTRFSDDNPSPKATPKTPIGGRQGYGAPTASPDTSKNEASIHTPPAAAVSADRVGQFEGHPEPQTTPNPVARFAIALTQAGFQCTSLNPDLVAYVEAGGTVDHLQQCAALPEAKGKAAAYAIRIARRELAGGAPTITGATHAPAHQRGNSGRRLSAVEQVEHAIHERREREARESRTLDA